MSYLKLGLSTQPVYLTNPFEPEPKIVQTDTPTVSCGSSPTKPDAFRSVGGFSLPKPEQPDPIINPETSGDIRRFFDENIQNPAIFEAIWWKFIWNPSDWMRFGDISSRSYRDLAKSQWIRPNIGHISMDPAKYRPDLDGTTQNNAIGDKNRNRPMNPKTKRNPNRPIRLAFWVCFRFYFDSPESFGSGPSRAQTRPGPTCGHPYLKPI